MSTILLIWFIANWLPLLYGLYDSQQEPEEYGLDKD